MKKKLLALAAAMWLCFSYAQAADPNDICNQIGAGDLFHALPDEAEAALYGVNTENATENWEAAIVRLFKNLDTRKFFSSALWSLSKMLAVAVIVGMLGGIRTASGGGDIPIITIAGALGMTSILLGDLRGMLSLCTQTLNQTSVFSTALLPVMAGALTASGAPAVATATQGITMLALDLLIRFITELLVPAVCAHIAIITVNSALGNDILGGLESFVKWMTTSSLKLILTVFIAYLSISGAIGGSVDAVTLKAAKFAVSGSVPVVGGIISDATESMLAGMAAVKNAVGILGMLGVAAICIAPFLQVGINYLLFKAGSAVLSPICSSPLAKLMAGLSDSFGLMLGMLGTCSAVLFFELVFSIIMVKPI